MSRPIAVLRPEPGNGATAARIEAKGYVAIRMPLFEIVAIDWQAPDPAAHDALILTSANAVRHGGEALDRLKLLPVYAVGAATGAAATAAGFNVRRIGAGDAGDLTSIAHADGVRSALHLRGVRHHPLGPDVVSGAIAVYDNRARAAAAEVLSNVTGSVAMLHSPRAAATLGRMLENGGVARAGVAVAAISDAAMAAAGDGWAATAVAGCPQDEALIAAAIGLAD